LEHVGLRHCDVDVPQIEQVVHVGRGAIGDDRKNPQVVAIVEHFRQLVGECHVGAGQLSAGNAHSPVVTFDTLGGVRAAFLERLGNRLRLSCRKRSDLERTEAQSASEKQNARARGARYCQHAHPTTSSTEDPRCNLLTRRSKLWWKSISMPCDNKL